MTEIKLAFSGCGSQKKNFVALCMISGCMLYDRTVMPKKVQKVERLAVTFLNTRCGQKIIIIIIIITRVIVINKVSKTEKQDSLVC